MTDLQLLFKALNSIPEFDVKEIILLMADEDKHGDFYKRFYDAENKLMGMRNIAKLLKLLKTEA